LSSTSKANYRSL